MEKMFKESQIHIFNSDEERNKCAEEFSKSRSSELRDKLIIGNIDVVFDVARREFTYSPLNMQDMVSEGITGLIYAIDTYGTDKQQGFIQIMISKEKVCFTDYISLAIRDAIIRACKAELNKQKDYSLEALKKYELNRNNGNLIDYRASMDFYNLKDDALSKIIAIADKLDEKSRSVVYAYYGINGSPMGKEEIAWELNISSDHIDIIINNIEASLRAQIDFDTKQK